MRNSIVRTGFTFAFSLILVAATTFVTSSGALAQTGSSNSCRGTIQRVLVAGNQRIEASTILSYTVLGPGDPFNEEVMDLSLKTLFATGLFEDVSLGCSGRDLVISVKENPIINRVAFENNRSLDDGELAEETELKPRLIFTRAKVQEDVSKIIERYRRSGRFAANVSPKIVRLEQNRVDVIYEISEGPVTGVSKINFVGNERFGDNKLLDVIATQESKWWNFFESNDNYDPDRLAFDREQLRQFYLSEGYADFRVVSAVAELTRDRKDFFITFTVEEGDRYNFGTVEVDSSIDALQPEVLRRAVPIKEGSTYDASVVENGVEALTFIAGAQGYAFVDVAPRLRRDPEARIINIVYRIKEGPRVYIERININGNTRTLDKVVRREFRLVEGDAYNKVLINRSRARIRGLGFFSEVEIEEEPGTSADKTVLNVNVEEQSTGELALGAGFSSTDNFLADFSITERNLLGRGQFLRLRLSISGRRQQVDIRFTEPYFLGRKLAAGFDVFKLLTDFSDESGFETDSQGIGLRTASPLTDFTNLSLRYTFRTDDIEVSDFDCQFGFVSRAICDQVGQRSTSVAGYTWSINHLNDPIEPSRGWRGSVTQDFAGIGGSVNYVRTEVQAGIYRGVFDDNLIGSLTGSAGHILGWGNDSVRLTDRFFKGGNTFRGFDVSGIGPRDLTTDDALGGRTFAIGSAELKFPLGLPEEFGIKGGLFGEVGTLGTLDDVDLVAGVVDDMSIRASGGVSVFWKSPFGPVRVDLGVPFLKEDYDKTQNFRFSAGTRF